MIPSIYLLFRNSLKKLRGMDKFSDRPNTFGADSLGFDDTSDSTVNKQGDIYDYYVELPFCEKIATQQVEEFAKEASTL